MAANSKVSTIILAAGAAERLGGGGKAFLQAAGRSYLEHAVTLFSAVSDQVIVTLSPADMARVDEDPALANVEFVAGGATRQASFENAFARATGAIILVQDVARPLTGKPLVQRLLLAAAAHEAVVPVVIVKSRNSLSYIRDGFIDAPAARDNLASLQTPQAYNRNMLARVLEQAKKESWHDTSVVPLVRRAGIDVKVIDGDETNIKVTYPEDIETVEREMSNRMKDGGE